MSRTINATPAVANLGIVRPPLVYLATIAAGLALEFAWPTAILPDGFAIPLGCVLVVAAMALFFYSAGKFRAAGTPVPGNRPTIAIVRTGPYGFSRNPIYVAFSLFQLGMAAWVVIPREERYLESRFGAEYLDYKACVRRWL